MFIPNKNVLTIKAEKALERLDLTDKKEVSKWLQEYNWIDTLYWQGELLHESKLGLRQKEIKKLGKIKTKKQIEEFKEIIEQLKPDKNLVTLIRSLQYLMYLHTYQLECLFASHFWCKNLFTEIAKRIGYSFDEYAFLIYPEILDIFNNKKVNRQEIFKRRNNKFAFFRLNDQIIILNNNEFEKIPKYNPPTSEYQKIKGDIACTGKVKGIVRIIKTADDFHKFKKDNILISPMTTIDFMPCAKKSSAIVTDEGGITCHAAIISREFKKPCIIGTKIATRVLKDGDLIEVDANKGVVKKLRKG